MIQLSDFYGYSMYTISSDTLSVSVMSLGATVTKLAYLGRNVVVSLKTPDAGKIKNAANYVGIST